MAGERTQPQRQYGTEEVQEILQRAARLEQKKQLERPMLSVNEIETIARESGLDPAMVRRAITEFEAKRGEDSLGARLAGAPLKRVFEREVEGEITTDVHEVLAAEIRSVMAGQASTSQVASLGRSLTWTGFGRGGVIELNVFPRDGKTVIRIDANMGQFAGGIFGGLIGGIGGGLGSNVAWILPTAGHLPWYAGAAGFLAVVTGAYGLARAIFVGASRAVGGRLEVLMDQLEHRVRESLNKKG
jgi:hypothetical protein